MADDAAAEESGRGDDDCAILERVGSNVIKITAGNFTISFTFVRKGLAFSEL